MLSMYAHAASLAFTFAFATGAADASNFLSHSVPTSAREFIRTCVFFFLSLALSLHASVITQFARN